MAGGVWLQGPTGGCPAPPSQVLAEKRSKARRDAMAKATRNANKKGSTRQKAERISGW